MTKLTLSKLYEKDDVLLSHPLLEIVIKLDIVDQGMCPKIFAERSSLLEESVLPFPRPCRPMWAFKVNVSEPLSQGPEALAWVKTQDGSQVFRRYLVVPPIAPLRAYTGFFHPRF